MDIIVVGGGPVGLMTAALLDAAGVTVEVFEQGNGPSDQSRGSTMHPRTLEVLSMLSDEQGERVSDVLLAQGRQVPRTHYAALPTLLDYRDLDTPYPFVLMISQWRTERALAAHARARGIPVRYGVRVTDIEQSADEVRVRAGSDWHTARYVIGADGAHSTVRRAAGIDFPGTPPDELGFVADVRMSKPVNEARHYWSAEEGRVSVVPLTDTTTRVFGATPADVGLTPEQVRQRQAEPLTLAEVTDSLRAITGTDFGVSEASWLSKASNSSRHAVTYRSGRALLVGDAAHVHLPAGGQGLNVGLQDATNLAWKLAAEIHGWAPGRLVTGDASYEAERLPVAARLVADTRAQNVLMRTFSPGGAALRDLFDGFIARRGEVAEQLSGWLSGLDLAYPRPDGAHPLVGRRAPDLALARGRLLRAVRPDRFLLLDLTPDAALAAVESDRVSVRQAPAPSGPHRADWAGVLAALIRPDGYIAHATTSADGLIDTVADAIAEWTQPDHATAARGL